MPASIVALDLGKDLRMPSYTCQNSVGSRRVSAIAARRLAIEGLEDRHLLAFTVVPSVETTNGTSADDAAIWIHPTDPAQSTIIGTMKTSSNGLRVYDLAGNQLQSIAAGNVNNVDLRYNFSLSGVPTTIVTGSNRSNDSIVIYQVDPSTRLLSSVSAQTISTGMAIYGLAMYVSPVSGKYYTFVTSESGEVQQWELLDNGAGKVNATRVRTFFVGSQSEGLVADDVHGTLYVSEEDVGIWKYSAEPGGGTSRTQVDSTGNGGHLSDDVEGLSIYYKPDGAGYLLASSQGASEFAVYRREGNNAYLGNFELIAGGGIDAVSVTDGIDVTNFPLGPQFPQGMFIAQDNDVNFKLARWDAIANAFGGLLSSDTTWDPRNVGAPQPVEPATVSGRGLFYNNSSFDGNDAAADAGDVGALAVNLAAYRPGDGLADSDNVSSYSRGINGLIIDVAGNHGPLTVADFTFRLGNNNAPQTWAVAPAPTSMIVRPGAGVGGSDRVHLVWNDGAIRNTWLEVIVEGNDALGGFNSNTGLAASDVFFWGNKVADSGTTPGASLFETNSTDAAQVFATIGSGKPITDLRDYNRDGQVTSTDAALVFSNIGSIIRLNIASGGPFAPEAAPLAADDSRSAISLALALRAEKPVAERSLTSAASIAIVTSAANAKQAPRQALEAAWESRIPAVDAAFTGSLNATATLSDDLLDTLAKQTLAIRLH
jgi:3-phytase